MNGSLYFRVRSSNVYGESQFSNSSVGYSIPQLAESLQQPLSSSGLVTVSTICVAVLSFLILVLLTLYFVHRNRNFTYKARLNQSEKMQNIYKLDNIELQTVSKF